MIRPRSEQSISLSRLNKPQVSPRQAASQNAATADQSQETNNIQTNNKPATGGFSSFLNTLRSKLQTSSLEQLVEFLDSKNIDYTIQIVTGGRRVKFEYEGTEYSIRHNTEDGKYILKYVDEREIQQTEEFTPPYSAQWYDKCNLYDWLEETLGTDKEIFPILNLIINFLINNPLATEDEAKEEARRKYNEMLGINNENSPTSNSTTSIREEAEKEYKEFLEGLKNEAKAALELDDATFEEVWEKVLKFFESRPMMLNNKYITLFLPGQDIPRKDEESEIDTDRYIINKSQLKADFMAKLADEAEKAKAAAAQQNSQGSENTELDEYLGVNIDNYPAEKSDFEKISEIEEYVQNMLMDIKKDILGYINVNDTGKFNLIWNEFFDSYTNLKNLEDYGLKNIDILFVKELVKQFLSELSAQLKSEGFTAVSNTTGTNTDNTTGATKEDPDFKTYSEEYVNGLNNTYNYDTDMYDKAVAKYQQILNDLKSLAKDYAKTILDIDDSHFESIWTDIYNDYKNKMSLFITNNDISPKPNGRRAIATGFDASETIDIGYTLNARDLAKSVIASFQKALNKKPNEAPEVDDLPSFAKSETDKLSETNNYPNAEKARKAYLQTINGLYNTALAYARSKNLDNNLFESIWQELKHSYTNILSNKMYQFVGQRKDTSYWTLKTKELAESFLKDLGNRIDSLASRLAKAEETPLTEYAKSTIDGLGEKVEYGDKEPQNVDIHNIIYHNSLIEICREYAVNVLGIDNKIFNRLYNSNFNNIQNNNKGKYISTIELQRGRSYIKQFVLNEKQLVTDFLQNLHNSLIKEIK